MWTGRGNVLGWFNELAFAPVDLNEQAMADEWSTDRGVGCKYFSQDAVIKLADRAGLPLDTAATPAEKLKAVQDLVKAGDERAMQIFTDIGCYLAHTIELYAHFYDISYLIVLGRVMSGRSGELILAQCQRVLQEEYPALAASVHVMLPDEKTRRVGQSVAAASLRSASTAELAALGGIRCSLRMRISLPVILRSAGAASAWRTGNSRESLQKARPRRTLSTCRGLM